MYILLEIDGVQARRWPFNKDRLPYFPELSKEDNSLLRADILTEVCNYHRQGCMDLIRGAREWRMYVSYRVDMDFATAEMKQFNRKVYVRNMYELVRKYKAA